MNRFFKTRQRGGRRVLFAAPVLLSALVFVAAAVSPPSGDAHAPAVRRDAARPARATEKVRQLATRRPSSPPPGSAYPSNLAASPALPHGPAFLQAAQSASSSAAPQVANSPSADGNTSAAQGVDVAAYQDQGGPINWGQVASEYQFAYIKATEGNYYVNPYFGTDFHAAIAQGMLVGLYEFATPNDASGTVEADYFLGQSGYAWGTHVLVPMVDLENDPYNSGTPCYGLSQQSMVAWIAQYTAEIAGHLGRAPVIYTDTSWWDQCTGDSNAFAGNPLWTASWGVSSPGFPSGFPIWSIWQYGTGSVPGIAGPCDVDQFAGDVSAMDSKLTTDTNGELASAGPADASPSTGRLDTFVRGTDGAVWDAVTAGGTTSDVSLGGGVAYGTSPTAVSWSSGRIDLFVLGTDHQLWHDVWAGAWSGWSPLGGYLTSSPAAASWDPGRLDIFAAGPDGAVWHIWYAGGWSGWESLGGTVAPGTGPAAASWGPGRVDFFVTGTDHQLWHRWYAGGWSGYEGLGGVLASSPAVASWGSGRLDVFTAGTDFQLWHLWYAGGWSGWEARGGTLDAAPGATSEGPGTLEVVVKGINDGIYLMRYAAGWSGYQAIPGVIGN